METIRAAKPEILEEIPTDASSVVEASAGTGKTFTLEHLIVELVIEKEISISNILVLTFTERATAELVERVRAILQRLVEQEGHDAASDEPHWEIDEDKRRRLREALFSFDRAPIYTIHGFCHRVLLEHAFANRRPFDQELVSFDDLFDESFHQAMREDFTADPELETLLERYLEDNSVENLHSILSEAVSVSDRVEPQFDLSELDEALEDLRPVVRRMDATLREAGERGDLHGGREDKLYRYLDAFRSGYEAREDRGVLAFLIAFEEELKSNDTASPAEYIGNKSFITNASENVYDPSWAESLEALDEFDLRILAPVLAKFPRMVEDRLHDLKAERGAFTYDDMISYVREAVEENDELVETLRGEYEHALVDEFQDTDPDQWAIFERVFVESARDHPCTLIGDPKQAIYGFRGADVSTYFDAVDRVNSHSASPDKPIPLPNNYRSTQDLISAYNLVFDPGYDSFFRIRNSYDRPVDAGMPDKEMVDAHGEPATPIVVTKVITDDEAGLGSDGFQGTVFTAWAEEIRSLVSESGDEGLQIRDNADEDFDTIGPGDIYVLTRSKSQGDEFAEYLRAAGVPYAFYKREGLFQTPEARDWLELLRAVERPGDRSRRLKAWATPFFGLELDRAAEITEVVDEGHELVERLDAWHEHGESGRIGQLVHQVLDGSGLLRRQVFEKHGERELTNYEHLGETFVDWAQSDDLSLGDIILRLGQYVEGEAEPEGKEGDLQRLETEEEAVQIMTMHKAKGLSAPVVFAYGGYGRKFRPPYRYYDEDGERVQYFGGKGDSDELTRRIEDYIEEEDERLLYVAMTRPEGRLYLPYADEETRDGDLVRTKSPAGPLVERLDDLLDGGAPEGFEIDSREADPSPPPKTTEASADEPSEGIELNEVAQALDPDGPTVTTDEETFGRLRADRRLYVESYKSVDSWVGYDEEQTETNEALVLDERAEPTDGESSDERDFEGPPPGQTTGLCVHELFEDLDYRTAYEADDLDDWRARNAVAATLESISARYGLEDYPRELEKLVWRGLTSPVRAEGLDLPSVAASDRQSMELEFWYPIPGETGATLQQLVEGDRPGSQPSRDGYLRGFIDLVFEWDGRLYIADWKTNTREGEDAYSPEDVAAVVADRYHIQSTFYATAAARLVARAVDSREEFEEYFGGFMYLFPRGMGPTDADHSPGVFFRQPNFDELVELEQRTGELVESKLSDHRDYIAAGSHDRWRA